MSTLLWQAPPTDHRARESWLSSARMMVVSIGRGANLCTCAASARGHTAIRREDLPVIT